MEISIDEAKNRVSELIKRAGQGEVIPRRDIFGSAGSPDRYKEKR